MKEDLYLKLLETFRIECKEHLGKIRLLLGEMEKDPTATGGTVDEIFRRAHSLKGAARAVDIRWIETVAHGLETLFSRIRDKSVAVNSPVIKAVQLALNVIEDGMADIPAHHPPADLAMAQKTIEGMLGVGAAPAAPRLEPSQVPQEGKPVVPRAFQEIDTLRVKSRNIDQLIRSTKQVLVESLRQQDTSQALLRLGNRMSEVEKEWEQIRKSLTVVVRRSTIAPELSRFTRHTDSIERRIHAISAEIRSIHLSHRRNSWALRHYGEKLQEDARMTRMVPAESVFDGFRKIVRDLSRDEGKEIEFPITGFEVEADRMVFQALKDPLMHLLRNAVVHGMESSGERTSSGKNPVGRVHLKIEAMGNRLTVDVSDDGRGIDPKAIAAAAVRKGFLASSETAERSNRDLIQLVFKPGFSTAKTITELSGRGMGLSIVHEAVVRLQGEVDLRTEVGRGTTFSLSVPLALSTHKLLLVSCHGQTFAIPLHGIERVRSANVKNILTVEGKPMIMFDGASLPLVSLGQILDPAAPDVRADENTIAVVVLRSGTTRAAVAVDAFLDEIDGLVQDLGRRLSAATIASGGVILSDGSISLVLNPVEILKRLKERKEPTPLKFRSEVVEKKNPLILVVDDSITTRTLEKSILEASGYDVLLAVDGTEALWQLETEPVDLVVADIEMPRMDGFALLEEMKKNKRFAKIPVIMVTSRENQQDRARGLSLGVDAYIVKRKFDQGDLLETIRQML